MECTYHNLKKSRWSKTIKHLCDNRCAYCGIEYDGTIKTRLESHHIHQRAIHPELECAAENGIALCHKCHLLAHSGNYQAFLNHPNFKSEHELLKKEGEVYEFTQIAFDTTLILEENEYEQIAAAAKAAGETVNGYIKKAIDQRMKAGE